MSMCFLRTYRGQVRALPGDKVQAASIPWVREEEGLLMSSPQLSHKCMALHWSGSPEDRGGWGREELIILQKGIVGGPDLPPVGGSLRALLTSHIFGCWERGWSHVKPAGWAACKSRLVKPRDLSLHFCSDNPFRR